MLRPPPGSTLFPYTTLFRSTRRERRSRERHVARRAEAQRDVRVAEDVAAVRVRVREADDDRDAVGARCEQERARELDRKSTRLNSSHGYISYAVFCLKKKKK